jgi:hypothetical protein
MFSKAKRAPTPPAVKQLEKHVAGHPPPVRPKRTSFSFGTKRGAVAPAAITQPNPPRRAISPQEKLSYQPDDFEAIFSAKYVSEQDVYKALANLRHMILVDGLPAEVCFKKSFFNLMAHCEFIPFIYLFATMY